MTAMDRDSVLAEQVEHTLAEIAGLEAALAGGELTVTGSTGQPVFTPDGAGPVEDELDRIRSEWEAGGALPA